MPIISDAAADGFRMPYDSRAEWPCERAIVEIDAELIVGDTMKEVLHWCSTTKARIALDD